jgi:hypothetical protein
MTRKEKVFLKIVRDSNLLPENLSDKELIRWANKKSNKKIVEELSPMQFFDKFGGKRFKKNLRFFC